MIKTNSTTSNSTTTTNVNKPVFTIPASFLAETSLSSLAKSAFVQEKKNQVNNKKTLPMNKSTSTSTNNKTNNNTTSSHNQYTTTTTNNNNNTSTSSFAAKKPTGLHLISLEEKLQMSSSTTTSNNASTTVKSPQTTTSTKTKNTPKKKKQTKETAVPQIALEKSPSTPKDLKGKHNSDQEVFSDCEELEDRATVILLSARSKYSTTLTSPRSSLSLASSTSSDDCSSEAYQSAQKAKLASLDEEEEYQAKTSNVKLKKSNQKLKKRVQTLTEEHNAALEQLSKLQEELVSLKTNFEKQLEESKTSSTKKIDILIDRTQHFKAKMKKTREELDQIEVSVITPLRQSLEKKSAEFEAIIESMKTQLKEQHDHDEISWKRILNEKELDFATKLELVQKEQQTALQTELSLRSDLEKIVQARTEEVTSLKETFKTIQQLLETKKIEEQDLLKKSTSREEELLNLLHQKELENQRIMQENAMLKKQVESLSKAIPKSVEVAEWKQQLAIPQRVEVDKSAPASLSVWRQMHGNSRTNNALRGTLANFLNKC
ncbi:hypothetical protein NAEGRDRAFT_80169 [Naegleria gruberi]|uniref:Uncharacterized protein n=1 Tax=Naegleria gruberi TaxID=5762 RepID=D2VJ93_NAEGR|nr:uncharacterized protein NAEGRDRAFT_80169 [Naegleria gruberi]EFC43242.1 hypothetical protein NAEGRDRAFT_80169 [Naegleria gruberi]|eukprot:XP_002675986.1 hypothetical protein NAEGRDRAFT_80169 [Naegleria gruberi strain NEG-M]